MYPRILLTASLLVAGPAVAEDAGRALAQKSGCLACHAVDKKIIGPSYQAISAKYKGDAGAEARLVAKVSDGGSGAWGPIPMPGHKGILKDEDIKTLVTWVLQQ